MPQRAHRYRPATAFRATTLALALAVGMHAHSADSQPRGMLIIDREQIQHTTATSLTALLNDVAGTLSNDRVGTDGAASTLTLSGFSGANSFNRLILLNGQPLRQGRRSTLDVDSIPLAAISRIEISPNRGAARHGQGASGGTINIITHQQHDHLGALVVSRGSGERAQRQGRLHANAESDNLDSHVFLAVGRQDGEGIIDDTDFTRRQLFADAALDHQHYYAAITVMGHDNDQSFAAQRDAFAPAAIAPIERQQEALVVMPRLHLPVTDGITLKLDAHHQRHQGQLDDIDEQRLDIFGRDEDVNSESRIHGARPHLSGEHPWDGGQYSWVIGSDIERQTYRWRDDPQANSLRDQAEQQENAIYSQQQLTLGRFSISAAARHSRYRQSDDLDRQHARGDDAELAFAYTTVGGLDLFASAQRSETLAPLAHWRTRQTPLRLQHADNVTTGMAWQQGQQYSQLTLWRTEVENLLIVNRASGSLQQADQDAVIKGVSLNTRRQLDDDITLYVHGALQDARFDDHTRLTQVPRQTLMVSSHWQALPWLSARLAHRYVGQQRSVSADGEPNLASYRSTDVVARAVYQGRYLELGVYNLEDNARADSRLLLPTDAPSPYALPGRHILVSLGFTF